MATAILSLLFPLEVIRTREPLKLAELEIVYDVGGGRFDHHGVEKLYREDGIPFAACGLIWKEYGEEVIHHLYPTLTQEDINSVLEYVDKSLIEGVDAQDNGIRIHGGPIPVMDISTIISGFNPQWYSIEDEDAPFKQAVEIGAAIVQNTINRRIAVLMSKEPVRQALEQRERPEILVLEAFCLWEEVIQNMDKNKEILFVVYPDKEKYAMQTVRNEDGKTRMPMPESWAGKENNALSAISGVKDAIFCHSGRFLAVAGTLKGILEMAELAIHSDLEAGE